MEEERIHPARPDEQAEALQHDSADQSNGRRFIAGFAAVGLGLAAIVAVWSWQASGSDHASPKGRPETSQEAAAISTGRPSDVPEASQSARSEHRDHANLPTDQGAKDGAVTRSGNSKGTGLAALGQNSNLPSNIWGGANPSGFAAPTETMQLSPGNPVEGGAVSTKNTISSPVPQGLPTQPAPQTSQATPQQQPDGGKNTVPEIPGLPSDLVPTQVPIPLPDKTKVLPKPGNTTPNIPQQSQPNPAPAEPQQSSDSGGPTPPQSTPAGTPSAPSRPKPSPSPDLGSARQGGVTDTTQE